MKSNNPAKPSKKDKAWQQNIEKRLKAEKVTLDIPSGKEQFFKLLSKPFKKK